jgi:hypothetical protein
MEYSTVQTGLTVLLLVAGLYFLATMLGFTSGNQFPVQGKVAASRVAVFRSPIN